jgi:hypothetical protein
MQIIHTTPTLNSNACHTLWFAIFDLPFRFTNVWFVPIILSAAQCKKYPAKALNPKTLILNHLTHSIFGL